MKFEITSFLLFAAAAQSKAEHPLGEKKKAVAAHAKQQHPLGGKKKAVAAQSKQQHPLGLDLHGKSKFGLKHEHIPTESRIVGGTQALPGQFPFFVDWEFCGASLIHEDIILSAAHCDPIPNNQVLIGAYEHQSEAQGAEFRTIVERRSHPAYNDFTLENDFLVMKLDQASTKAPVSINPDAIAPYDSEQLTVMGFGSLFEGDTFGSTHLQAVNVNAIPHDTCNSANHYAGEIVEDIMLCAGVPGGGQDSCQGDSGGPIIDSNGVQVGIVSWGYGCAQPEFPGVYARTSGVIDWINDQICELSDNPPDFCANTEETLPPLEGTVPVQMTLVLDDYPSESGYQITSNSTGEIFAEHIPGSFSTPSGVVTESLNLPPGDYELKIFDSFGDGICCAYGEGHFEVSAMVSGENVVLVEGVGTFTDTLIVGFVVPSLNGALPSAGDECEDKNDVFPVDSEVGDANCEWLDLNFDRYNYLCQFVDVAYICPKTCDACQYFDLVESV